jgi:uncharacterized protein (DUF2252 family)
MTQARRQDRLDEGRSLRARAPRSAWGDWVPDASRNPLARLEKEHESRVPELVPLRRGRMASSPFAFYRGGAAVMADDLLTAPSSGITVQSCGDAHLVNFGVYASPERALVFDLNDFDETLPGPFEWDVARLAASAVVAARDSAFSAAQSRAAVLAAVKAYRLQIRRYADQSALAIWYERVDADQAASVVTAADRDAVKRGLARTRTHTSDRLLAKLTVTSAGGAPRIVDQPPLVTHVDVDRWQDELRDLYRSYLESLSQDRRTLVSHFRIIDFATKVVGVGSVGTLCFIVLLMDDTDSPLFLQIKEAGQSVLSVAPGAPTVDHEGARVVNGQRTLQAASDLFLGWARSGGRDFYLRQLQDMKGSVKLTLLSPRALCEYLEVCGWVLARAHARGGQARRIAGYLGSSDTFDRAMARFAITYADTTRADHAQLTSAIADGTLEAVVEGHLT